jgi:protein NRD1
MYMSIPLTHFQTRWGVGFGPRDCSDYQTGVSVIPISKLTDADRKWMLTAEYGGSGGKPIESGMVVEEPDIEIGQGVSSKAISRRMGTDKGGNHGPKSGRDHRDEDEYRRDRRRDDDRSDRNKGPAPINLANLPSMPGYPYGMPMVNGMPMFPPGFVFPGQAPQQPPPPGRG